jgi:hypothetical protein
MIPVPEDPVCDPLTSSCSLASLVPRFAVPVTVQVESFQLQPFGCCIFLASANWRRGDSSLLSGDGSKVFVRLTLFVAAPTSATL